MKINYAWDLDGTLAEWQSGGSPLLGPWLVDAFGLSARDMLHELLKDPATGTVVIHSCRATWPAGGGWQAIAALLWSGGFNAALVHDDEPSADGFSRTLWTPLEPNSKGVMFDTPLIGIWTGKGKPIAHVYIDDAGICFSREAGYRETLAIVQSKVLGKDS